MTYFATLLNKSYSLVFCLIGSFECLKSQTSLVSLRTVDGYLECGKYFSAELSRNEPERILNGKNAEEGSVPYQVNLYFLLGSSFR